MSKKPSRVRLDLDTLLREFADSPQARKIRNAGQNVGRLNDEDLAGYVRGEWSEERASQIHSAILTEPEVAQRVSRSMSGGLPEGFQEAFVDPWLLLYFADAIPPGPLGDRLREDIAARFSGPGKTEQIVEIIEWESVWRSQEERAWLQSFLLAAMKAGSLAVLPLDARGVARRARLGEQRPIGENTKAVLLDAKGALILDEQGQPESAVLTIDEARIDRSRGLFVRLSTTDERLMGRQAPPATVRLSLRHENRFLQLSDVQLGEMEAGGPYKSRSATIRAEIDAGTSTSHIPAGAMVVAIQLQEESTEGA